SRRIMSGHSSLDCPRNGVGVSQDSSSLEGMISKSSIVFVCQKHLFLGEVQKPDLPATNQTLAWVQLARRVFDQKQKRIEYVYRYLPELPLDFLLYRCDPKGSKRLAPGFPMILIHQSGLRNASDKSMRLALTV